MFPDISRIHPSSHPSPLATQNTSKITLTISRDDHGRGEHHHPAGIGERERRGHADPHGAFGRRNGGPDPEGRCSLARGV